MIADQVAVVGVALGGPGLVALALGMVATIVVHEAGHALIGGLVGFRVFAIVIGTGPRLVAFDLGRTSVELHLLPLGGAVNIATSHRASFRLRRVLTLGAGPAANLALAAVLYLWAPSSPELVLVRSWLIILELLTAVTNLVPRLVKADRGQIATDGKQILDTLRTSATEGFEAQRRNMDLLDAAVRHRRGQFDRAVERLPATRSPAEEDPEHVQARAWLLLQSGAIDQAWRLAYDYLASPERGGDWANWHGVANVGAYAGLLLDDHALLPAIDGLSAGALQVAPDDPATLDTRGWALVELGRVEEGREMLRRALPHTKGPDLANVRAHLLCGALAADDLPEAQSLANRLSGSTGAGDPSIAVAQRRHRARLASLPDAQRAALAQLRPRSRL